MQFRESPRKLTVRSAMGMLAAGLIVFSSAAHAVERSKDYRIEVVDQPVAVSAHSEFNVKLTKTSTGQPVENAEITRSRLEMTMTQPPHKSPTVGPITTEMAGEVKLLGTPSPGVYRLMGDVSMPGTWKLDIVARVPGEAQPIEDTTTFKAGQ